MVHEVCMDAERRRAERMARREERRRREERIGFVIDALVLAAPFIFGWALCYALGWAHALKWL